MGIEASLFFGLLGIIIGSFLNVVIYRLPRGESVVFPGSHCTSCGHHLRPWELIPILSFLFLKGRCSLCQTKISWRYPLLELLNGVLYFFATWQDNTGSILQLVINFYFLSTLLVLAAIDWDTFRLPDLFTLPLLVIGIVVGFASPHGLSGWESLGTALGVGGVFWLIAWSYPQGMGFGDVKLIAGLGAFFGVPEIFIAIFIASFVGSIVGLAMISFQMRTFRDQIPFGPYLVLGAWIVFFWGKQIITVYTTLVS
ncbi:type 4 prepilin peptidase 1 [Desulfitobacterium dichloroeliminans LMG P-21439]|uniref:Prepilin leader peptidase/N-methyltransferase n=1 Tax=Desulfitobacterium dichloroeliminans (strain LMG P-21439 / DCA1) TaxID=871963 RepID=L0F9I7_DESDL|nr:A24 family peptidase [Desulfitobacterium dichloroeliminans]AGA69872.1 type 4 prepilin peptidase 1 [Desulfitobacterium dichloroeliminans LMG P-21439]